MEHRNGGSRIHAVLALLTLAVLLLPAANLTQKEQLGKAIFFDNSLSIRGNQSCAACHTPEVGFTGPDPAVNAAGSVYEGSIAGRFGNRKPPSSAYATPAPILHYIMEGDDALFVGGNFWDGRATGERLGNPAADQALGPFLNPAEQAAPDEACIVHKVCTGAYPISFSSEWPGACEIAWPAGIETTCATEGATVVLSEADSATVASTYDKIGLTVAAYEASPEVNAYSSKFDYILKRMAKFTQKEKQGFHLFSGKGKCARCHVLDAGPNGEPPLFTDFTYDNLGLPRNAQNPFYASAAITWRDPGLGGFLSSRPDYENFAAENLGKHKVPTLRNVDKRPYAGFVKAYGHNGYFKTLKGIVHFYNTRDAKPACADPWATEAEAMAANCWPSAEIADSVNHSELGDLHLTDAQEDAIIEFLKTLSDGYQP